MNIIDQIDSEIAALRKRKETIQKACSHPEKTSVNKGSDGDIMNGRDPSYWREHTCHLCGLKWTTSQNED